MELKVQKRLASQVFGCSTKRVVLDTTNLQRIKEAITKADIRSLINQGIITQTPKRGISRSRHRHRLGQKRKGRLKGIGTRKGKATARLGRKEKWMQTIRVQRRVLRELRTAGKITRENFRLLYRKAKGGNFRSQAHLMLYIREHNLLTGGPQ